MRVFKNRSFSRWARKEKIADAELHAAALEVVAGKVEADLGGYLFKKRIARRGGGKSGGYRTLIGYRKGNSDRMIFLYGFPKNQRANITDREREALGIAAEAFIRASDAQVELLKRNGGAVELEGSGNE